MPDSRTTARLGWRLALIGLFCYAVIHSAQATRDATLAVRISDAATGRATPARVRLQDSAGNRPKASGAVAVSESAIPIPKQAVATMWGRQDRAEGYALQPDGSFYVDGAFDVQLPPGAYTLSISKGNEYREQTHAVTLKAGEKANREFRLERWIDMPSRGWYSADDHVHLQRSPRDDASILRWMQAEDIHVGNLLEMGDFWATFFTQYAFGEKGRYREGNYVLSPGQEEPRTPEIGHTISLGANEFVRFRNDYYSYDRLFDRVRQLGGVAGFAHQGMSFHGYRGMTLNVLRKKVDFLELAQFCVPEGPVAVDHYYHFLDLGFRLTALAGSDFPWCGRGPSYGFEEQGAQIGNARFYAYAGNEFSFERWLEAVKAGRTFVTTGPVVLLTVNGRLPGDTLDAAAGSKLEITAEAFGDREQTPLRSLEIIVHGKAIETAKGKGAARLSLRTELAVQHGMWIAARCDAGKAQVAHTTPVYVAVNGGGFHNPETAARRRELSEQYLREVEQELASPGSALDSQVSRHKAELQRQIAEAREALKGLSF
ncbi:MAG: CehA/McbA family metallohydrolase [Bryobacteraceae bacterium]|nr:CehA/McbA family metallohydrolase [Bryobacteraceae bacterium]